MLAFYPKFIHDFQLLHYSIKYLFLSIGKIIAMIYILELFIDL